VKGEVFAETILMRRQRSRQEYPNFALKKLKDLQRAEKTLLF